MHKTRKIEIKTNLMQKCRKLECRMQCVEVMHNVVTIEQLNCRIIKIKKFKIVELKNAKK